MPLPPPKPAATAAGTAASAPAAAAEAVAAVDERRWDVAELTRLRLRYRVPWPLSLVIDAKAQQQYNQILVFIMQVCEDP